MVWIDGDEIVSGSTIDGDEIDEITIDGDVAWRAVKVIDDFEDNDISEYTGNTQYYDTSSDIVFEGSHSAKFDVDVDETTGVTTMYSEAGDGLDNYPSQGDTIIFKIYLKDDDIRAGVVFGGDSDKAYFVDMVARNDDEILIRELSDIGTDSESGNTLEESTASGITDNVGDWLEGEINWGTDDITFTVYETSGGERSTELGSVSTSETGLSGELIGIRASHGGDGQDDDGAYWDLIEMIADDSL